jgi:hypothetical protein
VLLQLPRLTYCRPVGAYFTYFSSHMKALILCSRAVLVMALCTGAVPGPAQNVGAVSLTQMAPASLRLHVAHSATQAGRVQVVRLSTGQALFTETYRAPAYGHRFDFSKVPSGRDLVWLQSADDSHRCIVRVRTRAHASAIRVSKLTSRALTTAVVVGNFQQTPSIAGL